MVECLNGWMVDDLAFEWFTAGLVGGAKRANGFAWMIQWLKDRMLEWLNAWITE